MVLRGKVRAAGDSRLRGNDVGGCGYDGGWVCPTCCGSGAIHTDKSNGTLNTARLTAFTIARYTTQRSCKR